MKYSITQQNGEFVVANNKGIIIAYCDTRAQAQDVMQAQQLDNERSQVESQFNQQQNLKALRAEFLAEFA
jgi:hypothetical protein